MSTYERNIDILVCESPQGLIKAAQGPITGSLPELSLGDGQGNAYVTLK